jgi:hypothetical protein
MGFTSGKGRDVSLLHGVLIVPEVKPNLYHISTGALLYSDKASGSEPAEPI